LPARSGAAGAGLSTRLCSNPCTRFYASRAADAETLDDLRYAFDDRRRRNMPFVQFIEAETGNDIVVESSKVLFFRQIRPRTERTEIVLDDGQRVKVSQHLNDVWKLSEAANK
jgi:hypothetical protein